MSTKRILLIAAAFVLCLFTLYVSLEVFREFFRRSEQSAIFSQAYNLALEMRVEAEDCREKHGKYPATLDAFIKASNKRYTSRERGLVAYVLSADGKYIIAINGEDGAKYIMTPTEDVLLPDSEAKQQ